MANLEMRMTELETRFGLSDRQKRLQGEVRDHMEKNIAPLIQEHERKREFPYHVFSELKQFGYVGGVLPVEDGGAGLKFEEQAILMQEAGRCWASLRTQSNIIMMVSLILNEHGTPEQKERYLQPLLNCEARAFIGVTEPDHGSDVAGMETSAVKKDSGYVVNGSKMFIGNGNVADFGILFARTDPDSDREGITAFIVDRGVSKYEARLLATMMWRANPSTLIQFEDMWIPEENVLGKVGQGLRISLTGLNLGRMNVANGCVGLADAALEASIDYAKERRQFEKPIGAFQMVQDMIARMTTLTEAARLLSLRAANVLDQGQQGRLECSQAKFVAAENAFEVASLAVQVHGGRGLIEDYPLERYFRDARGFMIPEGTSQIQKLIIGREVLGISAFV